MSMTGRCKIRIKKVTENDGSYWVWICFRLIFGILVLGIISSLAISFICSWNRCLEGCLRSHLNVNGGFLYPFFSKEGSVARWSWFLKDYIPQKGAKLFADLVKAVVYIVGLPLAMLIAIIAGKQIKIVEWLPGICEYLDSPKRHEVQYLLRRGPNRVPIDWTRSGSLIRRTYRFAACFGCVFIIRLQPVPLIILISVLLIEMLLLHIFVKCTYKEGK